MPRKRLTLALILLVTSFMISACHQRSDSTQIAMLNSTLARANENIYDQNEKIYAEVERGLSDPLRSGLAMRWAPTALQVLTLSQTARSSIDSLELELVNTNTLHAGAQSKLFNILVAYRQNIQHIFNADSVGLRPEHLKEDTARINHSLPILYGYSDSAAAAYSKNWTDSIFGSDDKQMTLAALKKVKNDISFSENKLISYCNKRIYTIIADASAIWPTFWQSAIHVRAGDSLEISAGMATFNELGKLRISIDGLPTPLNDHLAVRTIKVQRKPGKHLVPVVIEYKKGDGSIGQVSKMLAYYVQN